MRRTVFRSALITVLFSTATTIAQKPDRDRPLDTEKLDLKAATNKELIDQFVAVSGFGVGFHPTAWASGFVAVEGEPTFEGGILGSARPSDHPAMKELVARGVKAIPDLIEHLSDDRETKLSISAHGFAGATWHSDEYDPRYRDKKLLPKKVNTRKEELLKNDYSLRVGDLCYVAIGQIVNRRLNAVRYQPSGCYVINSPVATPELREAVKGEWSGLTVEEHKRSLIADAKTPFWGGPPPALERLAFYYPDAAEEIATLLLARQLYDNDVVWEFIQKQLVNRTDVDDWRRLVKEFREKYGKNIADCIPYWLHWIYWETSFERNAEFLKEQAIASEILMKLFADYDTESPPLFNAAELRDQVMIVRAVRHLKSQRVDDAVHQLFLSVPSAGFKVPDELALLAVRRLRSTDKRSAYIPFFEQRAMELREKLSDSEADARLKKHFEEQLAEYESILSSLKE